jgi:hypothetical protein
MVLLDYVANRGLRLPREAGSTVGLWDQVRTAARATGHAAVFPDTTQGAIIDDHTPFLRAGIPAVDLIDWTYPGHSVADTLDKLSPAGVDAIGETVVELVRRFGDGAPRVVQPPARATDRERANVSLEARRADRRGPGHHRVDARVCASRTPDRCSATTRSSVSGAPAAARNAPDRRGAGRERGRRH